MIELLGAVPAFGAALDRSRQLREMKDVILGFGPIMRVVSKRARHRLGAGHPEIIDDVAMSGVGKVGVDQVPGEVCAIARGSIEVIDVGRIVELFNQSAILLNRRRNNQYVEGPLGGGADHLPPFRLATGQTWVAGAVVA